VNSREKKHKHIHMWKTARKYGSMCEWAMERKRQEIKGDERERERERLHWRH